MRFYKKCNLCADYNIGVHICSLLKTSVCSSSEEIIRDCIVKYSVIMFMKRKAELGFHR